LNSFIERHEDKSNVSRFTNELIIISRHGFLISVELKFNDVKLVNFNNRRRFVGIKFISVVIVDGEFVELNMEKLSKLRKIFRISKTAIRTLSDVFI
jgi:hypothetical protein